MKQTSQKWDNKKLFPNREREAFKKAVASKTTVGYHNYSMLGHSLILDVHNNDLFGMLLWVYRAPYSYTASRIRVGVTNLCERNCKEYHG
jgi:hypothetical protein